jgi:hypothetical protein
VIEAPRFLPLISFEFRARNIDKIIPRVQSSQINRRTRRTSLIASAKGDFLRRKNRKKKKRSDRERVIERSREIVGLDPVRAGEVNEPCDESGSRGSGSLFLRWRLNFRAAVSARMFCT